MMASLPLSGVLFAGMTCSSIADDDDGCIVGRKDEYAKVDIPMLPVTHGEAHTINSIMAYTVLLVAVSILPPLLGMSGIPYLVGAVLLGIGFLYYAVALKVSERKDLPMRTFSYSITDLMGLFALLLADHYLLLILG